MMAKRRRNRLPANPLPATIHALSHDGRGVATIEGKTTFVLGALAGEEVQVRLLKRSSKFDEGVVTQIDKASPDRIPAPCPHFTNCGGCRMQHMSTPKQVEHKLAAFKEQLQHLADVEPEQWAPPLQGPSLGYRRKARLSVRHVPKKEKVLVGFRELNGRYVADNHICPILIPPIDNLIAELSELVHTMSVRDHIPQIELAAGDDAVALIFRHLEPLADNDKSLLQLFAKKHTLRIYLQAKGYDTIELLEPRDANPLLHYHLQKQNLRFAYHPAQFVQVNATINQLMINQALEWLQISSSDTILDLYCGIGNFSLPCAQLAGHVTGVEGDATSVARATENAVLNQIDNTSFYSCDLSAIPADAEWSKRNYNKLILDPPRVGAAAIVEQINRFNPSRILYVSCHPATLARDAKQLIAAGYKMVRAGIMDMFPHTQHVEAMALFMRE